MYPIIYAVSPNNANHLVQMLSHTLLVTWSCYRSQESGQSDESIDEAAATMILGDDASLLDDPMMNTINVDHVRQKLETLVSAVYYAIA